MFKLFSKRKKFSKENLVHQCALLEKNPKINPRNKQLVIETLRSIAELMIWGDQNDDSFFHLIAERNILGYFLSIVKQKYHRSVTIQVMQTLSIMIQNISKQQSLYYLFSNNYINDLVVHDFDFMDNEILAYYVSFLKTISLKLDENVINFFFNAKAHDFPLYSEALKFFKADDQMVRIAVRTLTLNVFGVDDPDLRKFITDKSAVPYFSNLTWFIRDQCIVLNQTLDKAIYGPPTDTDTNNNSEPDKNTEKTPSIIAKIKKKNVTTVNKSIKTPTNQLQRGVEEQVDHYYYLEDIFLLGLRPLSVKLMNQILSHLVLPVLVGSLVDLDDLIKKQQDIENEYQRQMDAIDDQNDDSETFMNMDEREHKNNISTSAIEIGDDDTQKASSIRKFLERRTRISKQLSLFLLTQVLTVFSDGSLINAIIVALMHPYPPKLVNQIVLKPPQHAVESSIPISDVLCQKRSHKNSYHEEKQHPDDVEHNTSISQSTTMKDLLDSDEQNKIQRSRIESVEKMDIIGVDSKLPEDSNLYRNGLLYMLNSDPTQTQNEQLIASTAALILTIIRNRATSEELLINAGICPQKRKRKRQLFSEKRVNVNNSSYATNSALNKRDLLLENEATISSHNLFKEQEQKMDGEDSDIRSEPDLNLLSHSLPSPMPKKHEPNGHGHGHVCVKRRNSLDIDINIKGEKNINFTRTNNNNRLRSHSLDLSVSKCKKKCKRKNGLKIITKKPCRASCDYPFEFVECIINVLAQCSKLSVFTIRVLSELLIDFVQDRTMKNNGLNSKHHIALFAVWESVKLRLSQYLPLQSAAMETYFIDTFEEEWRSVRQQPRIDTLIANPIRILPPHVFHGNNNNIEKNNKNKNTPENGDDNGGNSKEIEVDDQQQLIRKLERIRKSIHNLLHISRLKTELLGGTVSLPFIPRAEFKYYYRLQVALSTIAPGCLNCLVLMQSKKRRRVLFSIREPDWLLLFNRMKGRAGFAMVYMAIPIHTIEGVLNKLDPRVVHLSIRSPVRPHDAAIPISSQKNKWSITLFFDSMFANSKTEKVGTTNGGHKSKEQIGHKDALTALDYITMNRMRVRRKMMKQIEGLVVENKCETAE